MQPGLLPDEVEKLRWDAFGHRRAHRIASEDDLVRFTAQRGFVLRRPEPGLHYPSLLEAAVGRPLLRQSWDERGKQVESWARACIGARRILCAAVVAQRTTLLAPEFLPDFFALSGHRGDLEDHTRAHRLGKLSAEAAAVCTWLVREGRPLSSTQLQERLQMGGPLGRERLHQALEEAVQLLLLMVVEWRPLAGEATEPEPVCDLLPRAFKAVPKAARKTSAEAARARIACRYLRNVLVEGCHEMSRVLGWAEADTLQALQSLEAQKDALLHPSSRYNRWFFQAAATDLLSED